MDFTNPDRSALAQQLRKPEGEDGREVGKALAEKNQEVTTFTIECLHIQPADHVLEIGFGPGEGIAELVQLTPNGYIAGIDFSQEMVEMAEERNRKAIMHEHVELTLGDAKELPYEDESFDKVFAVNVFHFWPDATKELSECLRVLKPGGKVAFFMAYPSSWLPGLQETGVFIAREPKDVEKTLKDAGFTNVQSHKFTMKEYEGFATIGEKK